MEFHSDDHKGSFYRICHFVARHVRTLEVVLGEIERQLIVDWSVIV